VSGYIVTRLLLRQEEENILLARLTVTLHGRARIIDLIRYIRKSLFENRRGNLDVNYLVLNFNQSIKEIK
jgi:hypothetical protein